MTGLRVAVLVVNYFSTDATTQLIASVREHRGAAQVVISVVDNSGDLDEYSKLLAACRAFNSIEVRVGQASHNLGYGMGNNLAWQLISDVADSIDVVVIANPDVTLVEGTLGSVAQASVLAPNAVVCVRTLSASGESAGQSTMSRITGRTRDAPSRSTFGRLAYPGGHFMVMSRQLWCELKGFSPLFFLYCEEIDFLLRARTQIGDDFALRNFGEVTIEHVGGLTTGRKTPAAASQAHYHASRSRVLLYLSQPSLTAFLPSMLVSRCAWALVSLFRARPQNATAIAKGIGAGLRDYVRAREGREHQHHIGGEGGAGQ